MGDSSTGEEIEFLAIFGSSVSKMSALEIEMAQKFRERFTSQEVAEMVRVKDSYYREGDDDVMLSMFRRYMSRYSSESGLDMGSAMEANMDEAEHYMREGMLGHYSVGDVILGSAVTAEEREAVDEIKRRFFNMEDADVLMDLKEGFKGRADDLILYRCLRTCNGDVDEAEGLLRGAIEFRRERKPHQITRDQIFNSFRTGKCFYHGHSRDGHLTLYIFPALHHPGQVELEESINFGLWTVEYGMYLLREHPELKQKVNVVYDRANFSLSNVDLWLLREMSAIMTHYPDSLNRLFILRVNWLYMSVFKISKSILPTYVQNNLVLLRDENEFCEYYEKDQMLPEHGGTSGFKFDPAVHQLDPTEQELKPWLRKRAVASGCESQDTTSDKMAFDSPRPDDDVPPAEIHLSPGSILSE